MPLKMPRNRFYILILVFGTLMAQFSAVRWDRMLNNLRMSISFNNHFSFQWPAMKKVTNDIVYWNVYFLIKTRQVVRVPQASWKILFNLHQHVRRRPVTFSYSSFHDDKIFSIEPMISTPKGSSSSSLYPSSGSCADNPCENGGICISKGQTTFECRCVGAWRGIYCGIRT